MGGVTLRRQGCDRHMSPPLPWSSVKIHLQEYVWLDGRMGTRILIAEDDDEIAEIILLYCRQEASEARRVNNGLAALAAVEADRPQVIILDWMLPGLDGLEVCLRVRSLPGALSRSS